MQAVSTNTTNPQQNKVLGAFEVNEFASNHGIEALRKVPDVFQARGIIGQQEWDLLDDDQKKLLLQQAGIDPNRYIEVFNARRSAEQKIGELSDQERQEINSLQSAFDTTQSVAITQEKLGDKNNDEGIQGDLEQLENPSEVSPSNLGDEKPDSSILKSEISDEDMQNYLAIKADIDNQISSEKAAGNTIWAEDNKVESSISAEDQKRINEEIALLANNRDLASSASNGNQATQTTQPTKDDKKTNTPLLLPVNLADGQKTAAFILSGYQPNEELIEKAEDKAKNGNIKDSETWVATIIRKLVLSLKD